MNTTLTYEPIIRICFFAGIFGVMTIWELRSPRRPQAVGRIRRWPSNLGIVVVNTLALRILIPTTAVGLAMIGETRGWGLLNKTDLPDWAAFLFALIVLDLIIYFQHVLFHAVPVLWRLHRVHHADLEFDVSTGVRFHPVEILISILIKLGAVIVIGPPAAAVLVFEVILNATSMFNHGNVRMPTGLDRVLRLFVVTPDMHRVHHSIVVRETNSNYGFNLPWWDRLLGTYRAQPEAGHDQMTLGVEVFRNPQELRLDRMLLQPFKQEDGSRR